MTHRFALRLTRGDEFGFRAATLVGRLGYQVGGEADRLRLEDPDSRRLAAEFLAATSRVPLEQVEAALYERYLFEFARFAAQTAGIEFGEAA